MHHKGRHVNTAAFACMEDREFADAMMHQHDLQLTGGGAPLNCSQSISSIYEMYMK